MLPLSPSMPKLEKGKAKRIFKLGAYMAVLFEAPPPIGEAPGKKAPFQYFYALAIMKLSSDICFILTSERSGSEIREMAIGAGGAVLPDHPFLCLFDEQGKHHNLGESKDWADVEKFTRRALDVARERLGISEAAVEMNTQSSMPEVKMLNLKSDKRRLLLLGMASVIFLMLLFPPYRIIFRDRIVTTGFALIFDLPERASVDAIQLLVQWIGVLLVGGIIYLVLKHESER